MMKMVCCVPISGCHVRGICREESRSGCEWCKKTSSKKQEETVNILDDARLTVDLDSRATNSRHWTVQTDRHWTLDRTEDKSCGAVDGDGNERTE